MRAAFAATLAELAERDSRILLLTGDLGYKALEPFSERFPRRFFNVGVAEQNMVGLATGLAESGFLPFVYSIATFASLRAYEFIRNGPVAHGLKVRIVGVGGGFDYGSAGLSHHGLEDVGVLRLQPGLTVLAPADSEQTRSILRDTYDRPGPVYYRLSKEDRLSVKELEGRFALGRSEVLRRGSDVLLLVAGRLASEALAATDALSEAGIEATLAVVSTLNPVPFEDLRGRLESFTHAVTIEDHYAAGGLGSIVAEILAESGIPCRLTRLGVKDGPDGRSGSHAYLLERHGLSREAIVAAATAAVGSGKRAGS
jgi:transketolase